MSIIIKGMEMPKSCNLCPFFAHNELKCSITHYPFMSDERHTRRMYDCPLIELPPHGLIDKQMLLRNIADNQMANSGQRHDLEYGFWQRMWDYINDAPTIIEAEEETE